MYALKAIVSPQTQNSSYKQTHIKAYIFHKRVIYTYFTYFLVFYSTKYTKNRILFYNQYTHFNQISTKYPTFNAHLYKKGVYLQYDTIKIRTKS